MPVPEQKRLPRSLTLVTPSGRRTVRVTEWGQATVTTRFGTFSRQTGDWLVSPRFYIEELRNGAA